MKKRKVMYIVMRVQKQIKTTLLPVTVEDGDHLGFLSVYATKKAAHAVWGNDVELQECTIK
jgi:hypothetical protein